MIFRDVKEYFEEPNIYLKQINKIIVGKELLKKYEKRINGIDDEDKKEISKEISNINKLRKSRRKTLETKIQENNAEIKEIKEFSKGKSNIVNDDEKLRKRKIKRRKKLEKQNKIFRKELREKRKELKELESINERIENIHDHERHFSPSSASCAPSPQWRRSRRSSIN